MINKKHQVKPMGEYPSEPADVYSVLAELVKSRRLSVRESAAVSYAMGVMEHTFPSAVAAHKFGATVLTLATAMQEG